MSRPRAPPEIWRILDTPSSDRTGICRQVVQPGHFAVTASDTWRVRWPATGGTLAGPTGVALARRYFLHSAARLGGRSSGQKPRLPRLSQATPGTPTDGAVTGCHRPGKAGGAALFGVTSIASNGGGLFFWRKKRGVSRATTGTAEAR